MTTNFKLRSRLVDYKGGEKVLAYACGVTLCDETARFQGRLIDIQGGRKLFGVASECRHPAHFVPVTYVAKAIFPPFGISSVIKLQINLISTPANNCWGSTRCPTTDLTWDGTSWKGTLTLLSGDLDLELTTAMDLNFTGCITATIPAVIECVYPFSAGGGAPIGAVDSACCDGFAQPPTIITFSISSYTLWRFIGRLVDVVGGLKVFAVGECCTEPPTCSLEVDCCGCLENPLQWEFDCAGVTNGLCLTCTNFNAHWTLTYNGSCLWKADHPGICTPGSPWTLGCDGVDWLLSTSSFAGGSAQYKIPVADWLCFGPNTLTKVLDNTSCGGTSFPGTITLTAV